MNYLFSLSGGNRSKLRLLPVFFYLAIALGWVTDLEADLRITPLRKSEIAAKVIEKLKGGGVTISNVRIVSGYNEEDAQAGIFSNRTSSASPNIGLSEGLVLSTGRVSTLAGCKYIVGDRIGGEAAEDADLEALLLDAIPSHADKSGYSKQYDPVIITFDILPTFGNLSIDFVFGSDEYEEFVNTEFVDTYGFFVRGPGINGPYWANERGGAKNVAVLSDGTTPVTTNFVNNIANSNYYIPNKSKQSECVFDNSGNGFRRQNTNINGWTQVITSTLPVQANKPYEVKIALGEGWDNIYDSSVFIGQFKSQRTLAGRVFHHTKGEVNEKLLARGDQSYRYFQNTRVVLFDGNGEYVGSTTTDSQGRYQFGVQDDKAYRIAIDAATFTPGDDDADLNDLYPEQTWSSRGGLCADGQGGIKTLDASGYCYGGKTGAGRDYLQTGGYKDAEHVIQVPSGGVSYTNLNFGFSYDVVTHTESKGQGSLINFIGAANGNKGTGKMLFVPVVPANRGGNRWRINQESTHPLPDITRKGIIIDGRAWRFDNPGMPVNSEGSLFFSTRSSVLLPDLEMTTVVPEPFLRLKGDNQSVINTALTGDNNLTKPLIRIYEGADNNTVSNNLIIDNKAPGVVVTGKSTNNKISQNHFNNNIVNSGTSSINLPIDLNGDCKADPNTGGTIPGKPNKAIDRPYISTVNNNSPDWLTIEGFAHNGSTVEFYQLTHLGYQYLAEATEDSSADKASGTGRYKDPVTNGKWIRENRFKFTIPLAETGLPSEIAAIAIDGDGNTSEFSEIYRISATITASLWHDLNDNGVQEAGEPGLAGINVQLLSPNGTTTSKSSGQNGYAFFPSLDNGDYEIHVPEQVGLNGLTPGVNISNPKKITISEKKTYGVPFGFITSNASAMITPEHRKSTAPGMFVHFPHQLTSDTGGTVALATQWLNTTGQPSVAGQQANGWSVKLEKYSCDSSDGPGTPITGPVELETKKPFCFRASFFVPGETPQGVTGYLAITANQVDENVNRRTKDQPASGEELARVVDQIFVSDQGSGRLRLKKTVTNETQPGEYDTQTSNTAGSGDVLIYTIQFQNIGAGPLTDLKIMDDTPAFTHLASKATCILAGTMPLGFDTCEVQTLGPGRNDKGFRGRIIWHFSGTLQPGEEGEVSYKLMVE